MGVYQEKKKIRDVTRHTASQIYVNTSIYESNHSPVCVERLIGTSCANVLVLFFVLSFGWFRCCSKQTIWVKWGITVECIHTIRIQSHTHWTMLTITSNWMNSVHMYSCVCASEMEHVARAHLLFRMDRFLSLFHFVLLTSSSDIVYSISFNRTHTLCANTYDTNAHTLSCHACAYRNKTDTRVTCTKVRPTNVLRLCMCMCVISVCSTNTSSYESETKRNWRKKAREREKKGTNKSEKEDDDVSSRGSSSGCDGKREKSSTHTAQRLCSSV